MFGDRSLEERRERNHAATPRTGLVRFVFDGPQLDGTVNTLQRMRPDRHKRETGPPADKQPHRVRNQDLATISHVTHPRSHRHREADHVPVVGDDLPGVDPNPDTYSAGIVSLVVVDRHTLLDALTRNHSIDR
jgi:hypothetical protein